MVMKTETDVQNLSVLAIEAAGGAAMRNNSGVAREIDEKTGKIRYVRYGLGNTSENFNRVFKTGDLVGLYQGIFCMWECKQPGWRWHATERERAQYNAILMIKRHGGRAGFVTHPDEAVAVMIGIMHAGYSGWGAYHGP